MYVEQKNQFVKIESRGKDVSWTCIYKMQFKIHEKHSEKWIQHFINNEINEQMINSTLFSKYIVLYLCRILEYNLKKRLIEKDVLNKIYIQFSIKYEIIDEYK